ncbi:hypothetical protein VTH82DRAFT_2589 [Thermothelomyces myriococcoides]
METEEITNLVQARTAIPWGFAGEDRIRLHLSPFPQASRQRRRSRVGLAEPVPEGYVSQFFMSSVYWDSSETFGTEYRSS